jgi:hypothetical protein
MVDGFSTCACTFVYSYENQDIHVQTVAECARSIATDCSSLLSGKHTNGANTEGDRTSGLKIAVPNIAQL